MRTRTRNDEAHARVARLEGLVGGPKRDSQGLVIRNELTGNIQVGWCPEIRFAKLVHYFLQDRGASLTRTGHQQIGGQDSQ